MNDPLPFKYKLLLSYDGTRYSGWQIQDNAQSIQTHVQTALTTALRQNIPIVGSGRTDSGVHALEQVAHFVYEKKLDLKKLLHSLNGLLPLDIRVHGLVPAPVDFHARYSAKSKIYRYHLHLKPVANPFTRLYSYHIPYPLDLPLMKKAASFFIGPHNFTSFSNEAHLGSAARDPVRNLYRLEIIETEQGLFFELEADGFLYKMVRNIVGTLLEVARGKLPLEKIPEIFEALDRRAAPATAPPHGLFLIKVLYPLKDEGICSMEE